VTRWVVTGASETAVTVAALRVAAVSPLLLAFVDR